MKVKTRDHPPNLWEFGQTMVEYALIVLFLAIVMIAGLNLLGSGILSSMYNIVLAKLP